MDHVDGRMPMPVEAISLHGDTPLSRRKRDREHDSPDASNPTSGAFATNEANPAESGLVPNEANRDELPFAPNEANPAEPAFVPDEVNDDSPKNGVSFELKYT